MKYSEALKIYVNTGKQIPEKQFNRLSSSLKNSYLRMRSIAGYQDWEFKYINDVQKINYIETKGEKLEFSDIKYLLQYSNNKDDIAIKIIEKKGNQLIYYNIEILLKHSDNKNDIIATKIIDVKNQNLDEEVILNLLKYSKNKDDIATKIIETKGKKLNTIEIARLLYYSKYENLIKKLLLQNGVDYKLINDVIRKHFSSLEDKNIPLIPDNYQSMLNEIKRIKEIML